MKLIPIQTTRDIEEDRGDTMNICLENRTADTVRIYFEKAKQAEIKAVLPQKAQTVEEALEDYKETLLTNAKSYGKIIIADGNYIGDIWCYCIDADEEPNAMLSFCIFEKEYWSQGIATKLSKNSLTAKIQRSMIHKIIQEAKQC